MKKILKSSIILIVIFMISGCAKIEFSMGINKDKSMNLEIIEAFDKSLIEQKKSIINTSDFKEVEEQGFLVREYNDDYMQGYRFTKSFNNIDRLSTEESGYISDLSLLFKESDFYFFSIKKGFFKNTYNAKLKISTNDMKNSFDFIVNDSDFLNNLDHSQITSNIDMNLVVNLPYKVINSNAMSVKNDGKRLTWNLLTLQEETVDFEFELYNMTNVYMVIGGFLIVVILLVIIIVKKINKGNSSHNKTIISNNFGGQNYYTNTQDSNDYDNDFYNFDAAFASDQDNNSFIDQNTVHSSSNLTNELNQIVVNEVSDNNNVGNQLDSNDSILSNFESINYDSSSVNNMQNQTFISSQDTSDTSSIMLNSNNTGQVITSNQNEEVNSNSFFENSDDI